VIRCFCPSCSHMLEVPDSEAGTKRPCDLCGQRLQVPTSPRNKTVLAGLTPPEPEPVPVLELAESRAGRPRRRRRRSFRCPHCGATDPPAVTTAVSTTGWTLFGVGIFVFFPLAFLGLLIRDNWQACVRCGRRIRPMGGA
jgi:DNA-directed RNA polymerase subunit M/transcription elongation factor TFIIS